MKNRKQNKKILHITRWKSASKQHRHFINFFPFSSSAQKCLFFLCILFLIRVLRFSLFVSFEPDVCVDMFSLIIFLSVDVGRWWFFVSDRSGSPAAAAASSATQSRSSQQSSFGTKDESIAILKCAFVCESEYECIAFIPFHCRK